MFSSSHSLNKGTNIKDLYRKNNIILIQPLFIYKRKQSSHIREYTNLLLYAINKNFKALKQNLLLLQSNFHLSGSPENRL